MSFDLSGMNLDFRPSFNGSWGAGEPNSVSTELFNSYRANLEDAYRLNKTEISPPSVDSNVKNFSGTNFKSAFSKFVKRTLSERSPGLDKKSHRRGSVPLTARPPAGFKSQCAAHVKNEKNPTDSLAARLADLKKVADNINRDDNDDESEEDEDGEIERELNR